MANFLYNCIKINAKIVTSTLYKALRQSSHLAVHTFSDKMPTAWTNLVIVVRTCGTSVRVDCDAVVRSVAQFLFHRLCTANHIRCSVSQSRGIQAIMASRCMTDRHMLARVSSLRPDTVGLSCQSKSRPSNERLYKWN